MTAYANVELPLILHGVPLTERTKKTDQLLDKLDLLPYKNHYPGELSA